MCREWDVQDISQAPLVEGIKTSFGRYSHTPRVGSVEKFWKYTYIVQTELG